MLSCAVLLFHSCTFWRTVFCSCPASQSPHISVLHRCRFPNGPVQGRNPPTMVHLYTPLHLYNPSIANSRTCTSSLEPSNLFDSSQRVIPPHPLFPTRPTTTLFANPKNHLQGILQLHNPIILVLGSEIARTWCLVEEYSMTMFVGD